MLCMLVGLVGLVWVTVFAVSGFCGLVLLLVWVKGLVIVGCFLGGCGYCWFGLLCLVTLFGAVVCL